MLFLALFAGLATAKTIDIAVGKTNLTFEPSTITAAVGDKLSFTFYPKNHAVVAGDFSRPCQNLLGTAGFSSDFVPVSAGTSPKAFVVEVKSTDPMFFYCPQAKHCQSGMVGVINPSTAQTLDAYKKAAANVPAAQQPPSVNGGQFVPISGSGGSSTTATTAGGRTTTTSTSGSDSTTSDISTSLTTQTSTTGSATTSSASSTSTSKTSGAAMQAGGQNGALFVAILGATLMAAHGLF